MGRNVSPRFIVKYVPNGMASDIEFTYIMDTIQPFEAARLMREAGDEIAKFIKSEKDGR
jgi:hypothetical protein